MKKVIALLLAAILVMSLTLTASATEEEVFGASVSVILCNEGELYYGDEITLRAAVEDANMAYTITWQRNVDGAWQDIAGENGTCYRFTATPETVECEYRVVLSAD